VSIEHSDAKVVAISISKEKGTIKYNVEHVKVIENYGIENDAHAGSTLRQISLLSMESIERFNSESGFNVKAGEFSENVTTKGIENLTSLSVGSVIKIGKDVTLKVTEHGKEEKEGCPLFKKVGKCVLPYEGIFAIVLKGGAIKVGDPIKILNS
jgi:MOSC domain-containing protein YiiM